MKRCIGANNFYFFSKFILLDDHLQLLRDDDKEQKDAEKISIFLDFYRAVVE